MAKTKPTKPTKRKATKRKATPTKRKATPTKRKATPTKRKAPKRKAPTKRKAPKRKANPPHRTISPSKAGETYDFRIPGKRLTSDQLQRATQDLRETLYTYDPVRVSEAVAFFPWVARRMDELGWGTNGTQLALEHLANTHEVMLQFDDDLAHVMAAPDQELCPTKDDGSLLAWVSWPKARTSIPGVHRRR